MLIIQIVVLLLLILLSAFFSSCETAFSSANPMKVRTLADEGNKRAELVQKILNRYPKFLSTVLIGNNIVNISASALMTTLAIYTGLPWAVSAGTGILTFVVLLFGEIIPKTWANLYAETVALIYAPIVQFLMILLTPVIFIVDKIAYVFLRILGIDPKKKKAVITESELRTIVEASHEEGVIESKEREMINNVVDFGDSDARDIMIPRIDMVMVEDTATYDEVRKVFKKNMYTRLPVFHENNDNVVGVINIKEFLLLEEQDKPNFKPENIMREPYFTYEYKKTSDLLMELRASSTNVAMVLNEYGATEGMITLEDLLEEIVGEIRDEFDEDEKSWIQKRSDTVYLVPGNMKLDDINESLGCSLESEDYDSVGGLMIEKLDDRLPERGEQVTMEDGVVLSAKRVSGNRVTEVIIKLPEPKEEEAEGEKESRKEDTEKEENAV
ncbi:MAG: HlyC/CorC family transporter [Lachnospiraceae bacterium]|nr:HlyC/CorC family transporter [Lachnospiraceae bacterium]